MGAWPVALATCPGLGAARAVGGRSAGAGAGAGDAKLVDPDILPDPAAPVSGPGGVSPVGVWAACSVAMTRATLPGQNEPSVTGVAGPSSLIMAISRAGSGRSAGFFFRQAWITWRSPGGIVLRSGSVETIWYRIDAGLSPLKGGWPVAA